MFPYKNRLAIFVTGLIVVFFIGWLDTTFQSSNTAIALIES